MDIKVVLALFAGIITIIAYFPYVKDIFLKRTKPHAYTWLIWAITQGTATAALWYGGGSWATLSLLVGTTLVIFVFFLSLKYGTKNITKSDTVVLILALLAIVVWWQLGNPLLAVLMVSAIDGLGYIPTYRKSWSEPRSETLSFWVGMIVVIVLSILALAEYNLLTVTYLATLGVANVILLLLCIWRRRCIPITPVIDQVVK